MEHNIKENKETSFGLIFIMLFLTIIYFVNIYNNSKSSISKEQYSKIELFEKQLNDLILIDSFPEKLNSSKNDFFIPYNKLFLIQIQEEIKLIKKDNFISIEEYNSLSEYSKFLYKKDLFKLSFNIFIL